MTKEVLGAIQLLRLPFPNKAFVLSLIAAGGLTGLTLLAQSGSTPALGGVAFLRPTDLSVLSGDRIWLIARGGAASSVTLDGEEIAVSRPGPGAIEARVKAAPGLHSLTITSNGTTAEVRVFLKAAGVEPPAGWSEYKVHPPGTACNMCHVPNGDRWALRGGTASTSCYACHPKDQLAGKHDNALQGLPASHSFDNLVRCQACHDPHGSTAKALLKATGPIRCALCHGR